MITFNAVYCIDQLEIIGDAIDEVREWEEYEADMAEMMESEPYQPSEEDIEDMFRAEGKRWQDYVAEF